MRCLAGVLWIFVAGLFAIPARGQLSDPIPTPIPHGPVKVELRPVATGLTSPVLLTSPPDGTDRQFIVDQAGQVRLVKNGTLQPTPVLNVTSRLVTLNGSYDERGLLGLAFDPNFNNAASPGFHRVFTYTSEPVSGTADFTTPVPMPAGVNMNHQSVIASWKLSDTNLDVIDPASRVEVLRIDEPEANHNGGHMLFGPDGDLYVGLGDGGAQNDSGNGHDPTIGNGQNTNTVLGKLLRIDVYGNNSANGKYGIPADNPFVSGGGLKEIYATGFRNPYRFSFDAGNLYVGDVGQNNIEEIDKVELGKNYGWQYKEGTFKHNPDGTVTSDLTGVPAGLTDPLAEYDHDEGIAVVGGYVYHGSDIPALQGKYIFGDYTRSFSSPSGRFFYSDLATGAINELVLGDSDRALGMFVKGMGQDQLGDIYIMGSTTNGGPSGSNGVVYEIVAVPEPGAAGLAVVGAALLLWRRRSRHLVIALALLALLRCGTAGATIVTLNPSKDNTLFQDLNGSLSDGAGPHFYVGKDGSTGLVRRGVLAFDVASAVPAGATINSVALTLNLSRTNPGDPPSTIELHRLTKIWGEAGSNSGDPGGAGAMSQTGDATWIHTLYNTSTWSTPGGDFSSTVSASKSVSTLGANTWGSTPQMVIDVQQWLNTPSNNFGWIVIGDEGTSGSAKRFDTKENVSASIKPMLTIDYTAVPEPGWLGTFGFVGVALGRASRGARRRRD